MIRLRSRANENEQVEWQLKQWAQQLHDLTGRNRLLYYRQTKASSARIVEPTFFDLFHKLVERGSALRAPVPSLSDASRLLAMNDGNGKIAPADELEQVLQEAGAAIDDPAPDDSSGAEPKDSTQDPESATAQVLPASERRRAPRPGRRMGQASSPRKDEIQTNHSVSHLNRVLYNLHYAAKTVQEEQGLNILYVTFGMLRWRELRDATFNLAPLLLVPVRVEREHPNSPYVIRAADDEMVVNPVLQVKLSRDFGFKLPEVNHDLARADLRAFLDECRAQTRDLEGWDVDEEVTLGAFSFLTLLLIKDFEKHATLYSSHPLVRWLTGLEPAVPFPIEEAPRAEQLDDSVDPGSVFQVLDADSSQQEAIEAAKRGLSFILQGPPGTGKSQTIANLIAESIMAGKKVLFVSQKLAALEVVRNRLTRKGLADFCLEIHSHRLDKRRVVRDLMDSLSDSTLRVGNPEHKAHQREIREIRDELNAYVRQLHEPRLALGLSLFELQGRLAQNLDAPVLEFAIQAIEARTPDDLARMRSVVRKLAGFGDIIDGYSESPWRGYARLESSLQACESIARDLTNLSQALARLDEVACAVARDYGLEQPATILDELAFADVLRCFTPAVFSKALTGAITRYRAGQLADGKVFTLQYEGDSEKVRAALRGDRQMSTGEIADAIMIVRGILKRGRPYAESPLPQDERRSLRLGEVAQEVRAGFDAARRLFSTEDAPALLTEWERQAPGDAKEWLEQHLSVTDQLVDWGNFNATREAASEAGLSDFVRSALGARIRAADWEGAFSRRFYLLCSDAVLMQAPLLQRFRGTTHAALIRRFRQLDLGMIDSSATEIVAQLHRRKPQRSWMRAESAETSILRREVNKRRRIKPLRRLFGEIPNLIQALKPCLMMSPFTVSQLLDPATYHFDVAVFDEASQIPPEYAIGAFLRARQVIIAGDSQQLPPMSLFQTMQGEEPEDDEGAEEAKFESILTLCDSRGFPSKMLNWHYRSRDESLIAYSNHHFYNDRLFTFPNSRAQSPTTGLKFVFVQDGVYHSGEGARHNLIEAQRVAELAYEHMTQTPQLSLGIVAFSVPQRRAIEAALERMRIKHPGLERFFSVDAREPVFVKNLENVQGDERDVTILSVGYGRDATGRMALNFGPLNRDGGARRLNVAVTRARHLVYLVASIQPEEIDLNRATSEGARLLRNYLETARDGVQALFHDERVQDEADYQTVFEEAVFSELTKRGLDLVRRVGVSQYRIDLAVRDPLDKGRFILGLECDGTMYRSGSTARDRDRLRQQVLEGLGWRIHRIWSRDWIRDREAQVERVLRLVESADRHSASVETVRPEVVDRESQSAPRHFRAAEEAPALPATAIPYEPRDLPEPARTGISAFLEAPVSELIDALQTLANSEGPISINVAHQLVVKAWRTRRTAKVEQRLEEAIQRGASQGAFRLNGSFLWPIGRHVAPLRMHVAGGPGRSVEEIAPEEIEAAIRACVKGAVTIGLDDLIREAAKLFGLRLTSASRDAVGAVVRSLLVHQVLLRQGDRITAGPKFTSKELVQD